MTTSLFNPDKDHPDPGNAWPTISPHLGDAERLPTVTCAPLKKQGVPDSRPGSTDPARHGRGA